MSRRVRGRRYGRLRSPLLRPELRAGAEDPLRREPDAARGVELLRGAGLEARAGELLRDGRLDARGAGAELRALPARPDGTIRFRCVLGEALGRDVVVGAERGAVVVRVDVDARGRAVDPPGVRPELHAGAFTIRSGAVVALGVAPRDGARGDERSAVPGVLPRRGEPPGVWRDGAALGADVRVDNVVPLRLAQERVGTMLPRAGVTV